MQDAETWLGEVNKLWIAFQEKMVRTRFFQAIEGKLTSPSTAACPIYLPASRPYLRFANTWPAFLLVSLHDNHFVVGSSLHCRDMGLDTFRNRVVENEQVGARITRDMTSLVNKERCATLSVFSRMC
jgi:hypothetical protein